VVDTGEKMIDLQHKVAVKAVGLGLQAGKVAIDTGEKVVELHGKAVGKAVEVGVQAGKVAVETGHKAVEFGEHVGKKVGDAAESAGKKAAEVGEQIGKKAHGVADAVGDFLQSKAASVGAAGTALLSRDPLAFVTQMTQAYASGDRETARAMTQSAANHGAGQQLRQDASATVDRQEQHQAAERSAVQQHEATQSTQGGRSR
jgi:hypothetical protein